MQALTTAQVAALNTNQIAALSTDQIAALATSDLRAMTTAEVAALSSAQLNALSTDQMAALEKIIRFYYDLDINIEGIETITHLLKRINSMQDEITTLKNRLRIYDAIL